MIAELRWDKDSIDGLIFVSQTPDYILPATACALHGRLGLSKACAAFDVNLGCSGYVYGLWLAAQMIASGGCSRVLVLAGETASRIVSPMDRAVAPLFGDAGTATALERGSQKMSFRMGTDGKGSKNLIVSAGGFRQPHTPATAERTAREGGNVRSDEDVYMNGSEIFTFTLREVAPLVQSARDDARWSLDDVDAYVFHQANRFMLQHLAKKMKLPLERVVVALENFGNTSSASIPLAITHALSTRLRSEDMNLMLVGFGVGYSWGALALRCGHLVAPDLIIVPTLAAGSPSHVQSA